MRLRLKNKMTIDYKKLTKMESATICLIAAGLLILGIEFYMGMPQTTQASIKNSVAVLDMHESVSASVADMEVFANIMTNVYAEFNNAFVEVASINSQWDSFVAQSQDMHGGALALLKDINQVSLAYASEGEVMGVSTNAIACGEDKVVTQIEPELNMEYVVSLPKMPKLPTLAFF